MRIFNVVNRLDRLGQRRAIIGSILAVALVPRAAITFGTGLPWLHADSLRYLDQAEAIRSAEWLNYFPNGYPLLIAAVQLFTGVDEEATARGVLLLQVVLSTATVGLAAGIALQLSGRLSAALLAGLATALWPNQLNYTRQLMTEVPATFFLVAAIALLVTGRSSMGALSLGAACTIRTTLAPLIPLYSIWALFNGRRKEALQIALVGILPLVLLAGANFVFAGSARLSTNLPNNIIIATVSMSDEHLDFRAHKQRRIISMAVALDGYFEILQERPARFFAQRWAALAGLWGPWPTGTDGRGTVARLLIGLRLPLLALALWAWYPRRRSFEATLLVLPCILLTAVHVALFSMPRFTFPTEPLLLVLVALGVVGTVGRSAPPSADRQLLQNSRMRS